MCDRRILTALFLAVAVLLVAGCAKEAPYRLEFVESGAALTGLAAEDLAARTSAGALTKVSSEDAPDMRAQTLRDMVARGTKGARAAELLTTGFPERTPAVPILVRFSSVDGTSSVIVVEAFGDADGTLTHKRLWVFAEQSGAIVRAASFR